VRGIELKVLNGEEGWEVDEMLCRIGEEIGDRGLDAGNEPLIIGRAELPLVSDSGVEGREGEVTVNGGKPCSTPKAAVGTGDRYCTARDRGGGG